MKSIPKSITELLSYITDKIDEDDLSLNEMTEQVSKCIHKSYYSYSDLTLTLKHLNYLKDINDDDNETNKTITKLCSDAIFAIKNYTMQNALERYKYLTQKLKEEIEKRDKNCKIDPLSFVEEYFVEFNELHELRKHCMIDIITNLRANCNDIIAMCKSSDNYPEVDALGFLDTAIEDLERIYKIR